MKKLIIVLLICGHSSNIQAQNNNTSAIQGAAVGVSAALSIASAIYYEQQMREIVEQSATEWVLTNFEHETGNIIEVKLLEWDVSSATDMSSTSSLAFKYKKNSDDYKVLVFITSYGWWNEQGVVFDRIKPLVIDKDYWANISYTLLQMVSNPLFKFEGLNKISYTNFDVTRVNNKTRIDTTVRTFSAYDLLNFEPAGFTFKTGEGWDDEVLIPNNTALGGDEHLLGYPDNIDDVILDINERTLNLFFVSTGDLLKLKRTSIKKINRLLFLNQ